MMLAFPRFKVIGVRDLSLVSEGRPERPNCKLYQLEHHVACILVLEDIIGMFLVWTEFSR
jgi:hypothetical protein